MYRAPVSEIAHTLRNVTSLGRAVSEGRMGDLSDDVMDAILEEAGRFASEEIAPLLGEGDRFGTPLKDGEVSTAPGWKDVYRAWTEGGWGALTAPEAYGGQDLPQTLNAATFEMWHSGSVAFALCPTLTGGAVEAIAAHASDALKQQYLPRMVSGEWTGTMNLTEPQAGSDLNAVKARAEPAGDGTYRLFGTKIYITFGEHDLADNIVHLVLARLPDAPEGTRGISLFLVPKFLVEEDGTLGARNDVFCNGVEHKLGIHGSPTCTMIYGDNKFTHGAEGEGAVGYLVGEENRGLACMFTMMNNARMLVGVSGVSVAEAATQKALAYANERRQGKHPEAEGTAPIVLHPDVQRNLLSMRALTDAARAITYNCAFAIDMADETYVSARGAAADADGPDGGSYWADRAGILTPICKAFATDIGVEVASIGVQVHGGMGFVEETGAAQLLRDSRIGPIYEGTNGIQAIDLVVRKLPLEGGDAVRGYLGELREIAREARASNQPRLVEVADAVETALDDVGGTVEHLLERLANKDVEGALAGATPFLRQFALAAGGAYLAKSALAGERSDERVALAHFFARNHLPEVSSLRRTIEDGAESLQDAARMLQSA